MSLQVRPRAGSAEPSPILAPPWRWPAGYGGHRPAADIEADLRTFLAARGPLDVLQLSGGEPLFGAGQATWNLLEPSVEPALAEAAQAGWAVIVQEAVANGRLTAR